MKLILASPMGFCAGVERAVSVLDEVIRLFPGEPVYVRHEIVHNQHVVKAFEQRGVFFVESLGLIPKGAITVFSAHGVSKALHEEAEARMLRVFDATCPLVAKVHLRAARSSKEGRDAVLIGHGGHVEVQGTIGHFDSSFGGTLYLVQSEQEIDTLEVNQPENLFVLTQTTLSVSEAQTIIDKLVQKFPATELPKSADICYATDNRQQALEALCDVVDKVLVIGSSHSSNTQRLVELSKERKTPVYRIPSKDHIQSQWLEGVGTLGLTAGASTPDEVVQSVVSRLIELGAEAPTVLPGKKEDMFFPLPKVLRELSASRSPIQENG